MSAVIPQNFIKFCDVRRYCERCMNNSFALNKAKNEPTSFLALISSNQYDILLLVNTFIRYCVIGSMNWRLDDGATRNAPLSFWSIHHHFKSFLNPFVLLFSFTNVLNSLSYLFESTSPFVSVESLISCYVAHPTTSNDNVWPLIDERMDRSMFLTLFSVYLTPSVLIVCRFVLFVSPFDRFIVSYVNNFIHLSFILFSLKQQQTVLL